MVGGQAPSADTTAVTGVSAGIDDDPPSGGQGCRVDTTDGQRRRGLTAEAVEHAQQRPFTAQARPPGVVPIAGENRNAVPFGSPGLGGPGIADGGSSSM
ncbi:MAG: hypothetical protein RJA14_1155, partial [Pseudomonadota bacterium]